VTHTSTPVSSTATSTVIAAVEAARADLLSQVNQAFDSLIAQLSPSAADANVVYKVPTLADGHDPRNKNGANLTPRGAEILYRVFDEGGGYNRASKMLNITQGAAKNRKALWVKLGGKSRPKMLLDIDAA